LFVTVSLSSARAKALAVVVGVVTVGVGVRSGQACRMPLRAAKFPLFLSALFCCGLLATLQAVSHLIDIYLGF